MKVFTRKGAEKDERSLSIERAEEEKLLKNLNDERRILEDERNKRIYELLEGHKLAEDLSYKNRKLLTKGTKLPGDCVARDGALRKIEIASPSSKSRRDRRHREANRTADKSRNTHHGTRRS